MDTNNPYATPAADLIQNAPQNIQSLNVSERWKKIFTAYHRLGGVKMTQLKGMERSERAQLVRETRFFGYSILAYLFGPLYYIYLGMWKKALTWSLILYSLALALVLAFIALGWGDAAKSIGYGISAVWMIIYTQDYYQFKVLNDTGWKPAIFQKSQ